MRILSGIQPGGALPKPVVILSEVEESLDIG